MFFSYQNALCAIGDDISFQQSPKKLTDYSHEIQFRTQNDQ